MMMRKHWPMWTYFLCLLALLLSGCGSSPVEDEMPAQETATMPPATGEAVTAIVQPTERSPLPTATPTGAPTGAPADVPTATREPSPQAVSPLPTATLDQPTDTPPSAPTKAPTEEPPSPAPTALPTALPTVAPTSTPTQPAIGEIKSFTVVPQVARNLGDKLQLAWQAAGDKAELCFTNCFGPALCEEVALSGNKSIVANEETLNYNGFALRVTSAGQESLAAVTVQFLCEDLRPWFFGPPPPYCPQDEASETSAAGQYFERGFMIWTEEPDRFYVFESAPDKSGFKLWYSLDDPAQKLKPGASPDNRIGETPPASLYEPVSGFGQVWRGEFEWPEAENVRERLGWATGPEFGFESAAQYAITACPRGWTQYMRGPRGEILRLWPASTIGWPLIWEQEQP